MTTKELRALQADRLPETGATTQRSVKSAIERGRHFVRTYYPHSVAVGVGRGWGVTATRDALGNTTFPRAPDSMIVITMKQKSNCPDPSLGTLFMLSKDNIRVPARFLYRP